MQEQKGRCRKIQWKICKKRFALCGERDRCQEQKEKEGLLRLEKKEKEKNVISPKLSKPGWVFVCVCV